MAWEPETLTAHLMLVRGRLRPADGPQTPLTCSYIPVSLESRVLVMKWESYKLLLKDLPFSESQFHFRTVSTLNIWTTAEARAVFPPNFKSILWMRGLLTHGLFKRSGTALFSDKWCAASGDTQGQGALGPSHAHELQTLWHFNQSVHTCPTQQWPPCL